MIQKNLFVYGGCICDFKTAYHLPNTMSTIFSSKKSLIFGEFDMYSTKVGIYDVNISIEEMDSGIKIIETFQKQCTWSHHKITLPKPIIIQENMKYKIRLECLVNGIQLKSCNKMENEIYIDGVTATIIFHRDTTSNFDNVKKGSIISLYFNKINEIDF